MKRAHSVHLLTASGIVPAALAMLEVTRVDCDPRVVFAYLLLTTLIDAVDGPLARRWDVKVNAPSIDGRTIDDLLDYLTFAFIPLMLIWRMNWLPAGFGWTVILAMGASLLGFAHRSAKDEERGLFRGFPSYWNLYAIYAAVFSTQISPWLTAVILWLLTVMTVSPIWLIYPNLVSIKLKRVILLGALAWLILLAIIIWNFPASSLTLTLISLLYPLFYLIASVRYVRATR